MWLETATEIRGRSSHIAGLRGAIIPRPKAGQGCPFVRGAWLAITFLTAGCITGYTREPPAGVWPAGALESGKPTYFVGWKIPFRNGILHPSRAGHATD